MQDTHGPTHPFFSLVLLLLLVSLASAPHDTLLVVDASVGRNAVDQARTWKEEVSLYILIDAHNTKMMV